MLSIIKYVKSLIWLQILGDRRKMKRKCDKIYKMGSIAKYFVVRFEINLL